MTEPNVVVDSVLEEFRCFQCKNYLSVSPIVILPNGNSLCGICSTSVEETTYKQLTFEHFLKTLVYPCKFKSFGCKELSQFGKTEDHAAKCIYRPMICPVSVLCSWEGPLQEMINHFSSSHSSLVANKMEFKLDICGNHQNGLLMTCINGVNGILKYYYNADTGNLQYDIQHFNIDVEELLVKISIINDSDLDYKIQLKGDPSSHFNNSFYRDFCENPSSKMLAFHNLFPVLNNPNCVTIEMTLQALESDNKGKKQESDESELSVDYDLISDLKCSNCQGYLLPPLYKHPGSGNPMCCYCHDQYPDAQPELDKDILEEVVETNFPCRWWGCEVIEQGNNIVNHELSCEERMFTCCICTENMIERNDIISHIREHRYRYFVNCFTYTNIILKNNHSEKKLFTFKNHNIVYITVTFNPYKHSITLSSDNEFNNDTTLIVQLEHDHCKISPKTCMKVPMNYTFDKDYFPACFNNNKSINVKFKIQ